MKKILFADAKKIAEKIEENAGGLRVDPNWIIGVNHDERSDELNAGKLADLHRGTWFNRSAAGMRTWASMFRKKFSWNLSKLREFTRMDLHESKHKTDR